MFFNCILKYFLQASGWLWDEEDPLLYSLSRRVSRATRLAAHKPQPTREGESLGYEEAEPWQVGGADTCV